MSKDAYVDNSPRVRTDIGVQSTSRARTGWDVQHKWLCRARLGHYHFPHHAVCGPRFQSFRHDVPMRVKPRLKTDLGRTGRRRPGRAEAGRLKTREATRDEVYRRRHSSDFNTPTGKRGELAKCVRGPRTRDSDGGLTGGTGPGGRGRGGRGPRGGARVSQGAPAPRADTA